VHVRTQRTIRTVAGTPPKTSCMSACAQGQRRGAAADHAHASKPGLHTSALRNPGSTIDDMPALQWARECVETTPLARASTTKTKPRAPSQRHCSVGREASNGSASERVLHSPWAQKLRRRYTAWSRHPGATLRRSCHPPGCGGGEWWWQCPRVGGISWWDVGVPPPQQQQQHHQLQQ
jgi:hypothetical protein